MSHCTCLSHKLTLVQLHQISFSFKQLHEGLVFLWFCFHEGFGDKYSMISKASSL